MALFKPYKIQSSQLNSLPKKEGQLIVTTDDKALYIDISNSQRIKVYSDELAKIDDLDGIAFSIVNELPTTNIDPNLIYLIESTNDSVTPAQSVTYNMIEVTAPSGYETAYTLTQNGIAIGTQINIPITLTTQDVQNMINTSITNVLEASY